jgi:alpha-ketoglutarate-dependent taurine dioxygenase
VFRASLLRMSDDDHILMLNMHHIVSDGWSAGILFRELGAIYEAYSANKPSPLAPLSIQYADYAAWQEDWLEAGVMQEQLAYWKKLLSAMPATLEIATGGPRPSAQSYRGAKHFLELPGRTSERIRSLSQSEGVTLFMTLMAAFQLFLYRRTGQEKIIVGTDVANRNRVETEGLIGFFVNLLPICADLSGNPSFRELLKRVRDVALGAYAHQDLPFEKLVEEVRPERELNRNPLVQVLFVMQNAPGRALELPGLTLKPFEVHSGTSRFDLALFMSESGQQITGAWVYSTDLFDAASIARMSRHFENLLEAVVADPDGRLETFEMLTETERKRLAAEKMERRRSQLGKLMSVRRKALDPSAINAVKTGYLGDGETLPLVIEPAIEGGDLSEWVAINREFIEEQLLKNGALLFRGFDLGSTSEFEKVALALCPELFGEYGDLPRERMGGNVYGSTPYPADTSIQFHNESSHMHRWPIKIWFFCVKAAEQGGETPILDCRKVYQLLNPKIRDRFNEKKLMYVRNYTDGLDVGWQTFFRTTDRAAVEDYCRKASIDFEWKKDNGLRTRQISPAVVKHPKTGEMVFFNQIQLHHVSCLDPAVRESLLDILKKDDLPRNVYYADGSPIEDLIVEELGELYQKTSVSFPWREGDILMLDNMMVAHGRKPYVGSRKIVVAMGEMISKEDVS